MKTPSQRQAWVQELTDPLATALLPTTKPAHDLSVKDVAFREALNAYVVGLPVSAVLAAHAACEISLAERLVSHLILKGMQAARPKEFTPESFLMAWDSADKEATGIPGIKDLLRRLNEVGAWVRPSLQAKLKMLASNRQHLAHYRPYHRQKSRRLEVTPDGRNFMGSFLPSIHIQPNRLETSAEHGLRAMVELWVMPIVSFNPGSPPSQDWEPPAITPASPEEA